MIYDLLGISALAGLAIIIIMIPINAGLVKSMKALEKRKMEVKDERIKLMSELLNGIKVLKLYAWELSFEEKVNAVREMELENLWSYKRKQHWNGFFWHNLSFMVGNKMNQYPKSLGNNHETLIQ